MSNHRDKVVAFAGMSAANCAWANSLIGTGMDTFSFTNMAAIGSKTLSGTETSAPVIAAFLVALTRHLKNQGVA